MEKVCWSPLKLCSSSGSSRLREREIFRNVERFLIRLHRTISKFQYSDFKPKDTVSFLSQTMVSQLVKHERIETTVAKYSHSSSKTLLILFFIANLTYIVPLTPLPSSRGIHALKPSSRGTFTHEALSPRHPRIKALFSRHLHTSSPLLEASTHRSPLPEAPTGTEALSPRHLRTVALFSRHIHTGTHSRSPLLEASTHTKPSSRGTYPHRSPLFEAHTHSLSPLLEAHTHTPKPSSRGTHVHRSPLLEAHTHSLSPLHEASTYRSPLLEALTYTKPSSRGIHASKPSSRGTFTHEALSPRHIPTLKSSSRGNHSLCPLPEAPTHIEALSPRHLHTLSPLLEASTPGSPLPEAHTYTVALFLRYPRTEALFLRHSLMEAIFSRHVHTQSPLPEARTHTKPFTRGIHEALSPRHSRNPLPEAHLYTLKSLFLRHTLTPKPSS
ncbi:hypothetical protein LguiB_016800 [Lonicera macranthoides]